MKVRAVIGWMAVLALTAGLVACGNDDDTEATTPGVDGGEVTVADPWARSTAPGAANGAVYLRITASEGDALVDAAVGADVASSVEIHETVAGGDGGDGEDGEDGEDRGDGDAHGSGAGGMTNATGPGTMSMRPITQLVLPAGETIELRPGGYHIMLMGLTRPLEAGSEFELTLRFEEADDLTIEVPVRDDAP